MTFELDFIQATVSALVPVTLAGVVVGISKVAEFNQHKKTTEQWMEETAKKMDKHESNDENRQREVLRRIETMEGNILDIVKEQRK